MSRIIFPSDFAAQKKLLENIIAKHSQDGANSLLTSYLLQQQIDLDDCLTKANAAEGFNDQQFNTHQQSEKNNELKGFKSEAAIKNLKNEVQFLKKLFVSTPKELSDWGIRVIGNNRIQYPQNFNALARMAVAFFDKHLGYAAGTSPLQAFVQRNNIDVAADKTAIEEAILLKDKADTQAEQAASFTQQRNVLWQPVVKKMKEIGDYLKSVYINNPYSLGDYGFLVEESKRKPRIVTTKILLGQSKTLKNLVIGSKLVNKGPVALVLYKGNKPVAQNITVLPGQTIEIPKGFSTITVVNEDMTQTAIFSAQRII
jgi:hypothetical protein